MSSTFAEKIGLATQPFQCKLTFGDGSQQTSSSYGVATLRVGRYERVFPFIVADIPYDIILGLPWYESVGTTTLRWDKYKRPVLQFQWTGLNHRWKSTY